MSAASIFLKLCQPQHLAPQPGAEMRSGLFIAPSHDRLSIDKSLKHSAGLAPFETNKCSECGCSGAHYCVGKKIESAGAIGIEACFNRGESSGL